MTSDIPTQIANAIDETVIRYRNTWDRQPAIIYVSATIQAAFDEITSEHNTQFIWDGLEIKLDKRLLGITCYCKLEL